MNKLRKQIQVSLRDKSPSDMTVEEVLYKMEKLKKHIAKADNKIVRYNKELEREISVDKKEKEKVKQGLEILENKFKRST